jgi:DNA-binding MurR/RpiR family transcriptional regulator
MSIAKANPPVGGTVSVIRSLLPSLVPSERRVAQECIDFPGEVALLSVADLAARTGTSATTVIRTCQNLGFKGFQHLRLLLLRDAGSAGHPEPMAATDGDSRHRVELLFDEAARQLRDALGALDYERFDAAAAAIAGARRVLIVGNGGSGPAAQMFALRLTTTGRFCEAPYDAVTQQLTARLLTPDDVCVAISDSGMNGITLGPVEAAHAAGATIIGVTSYARSRLNDLATMTLIAGASFHSWGDGAVTGNITQMLLLSALQDAVTAVTGGASGPGDVVMDEVFQIVHDSDAQN